MVGERRKGVAMRAKYLRNDEPKQPEEISDVLASVIEKAAVGVDIRHGQLVDGWDSVVPPDWQRFGTPVGVKGGTLLVEVPDGSAASLLKYQINDLILAIDQQFGSDLVRDVRIKIGHAPSTR